MRVAEKNSIGSNSFIQLHGLEWLHRQRIAGRIAARALLILEDHVREKTSHSLIVLNEIAKKFITDAGGSPTFKGYKGFPADVCMSVNKQLVHGIPTDIVLEDGDLISFDLGVTYEGAIADTAITCIFGTPKSNKHIDLVKSTEESLMKSIESVAVGKRLGCIGQTISKYAKGKGYGVINNYGGHGLNWNVPHAAPFVQNKSTSEEGIRIQPGLSIAIEPMLTLGSTNTHVLDDGWTVVTDDINCHFEHSIYIHEDHVEIITDRRGL